MYRKMQYGTFTSPGRRDEIIHSTLRKQFSWDARRLFATPNSQDAKTLEKSLRVLKPGGLLISISGPPDPAFAKELSLNLFLKLVMRLLSRGVRREAKSLGIRYSFLFMRAQGQQLSEIASLIESGAIQPVVDKVFPFEKTGDALAYVETGRARGKVVITVKA